MKLLESIRRCTPASAPRRARALRRVARRASLQNTLSVSGVPNRRQRFILFVFVTLDNGERVRLRTLGLRRTC
jgi:hypothetical protein